MTEDLSRHWTGTADSAVAPANATVDVALYGQLEKEKPEQNDHLRVQEQNREYYKIQIGLRWTHAYKAIMSVCHLIVEARFNLPAQEWKEFLEQDCPFEYSVVQKFLKMAKSQRLNDAENENVLPHSWTSLYEVMQMKDETFRLGVQTGVIHSASTLQALKHLRRQHESPKRTKTPQLSPDEELVNNAHVPIESTCELGSHLSDTRSDRITISLSWDTKQKRLHEVMALRAEIVAVSCRYTFIHSVDLEVEEQSDELR